MTIKPHGGEAKHYPSVIMIRAHIMPEFVADTIDAVRFFSQTNPLIVVSVDRNPRIQEEITKYYPDVWCYTSDSNCGWGGGLWRLFCEAVCWLCRDRQITFDYLWNIDYDLIPISPGYDSYFIKRFDKPQIGQIGRHNPNSSHWKQKMRMALSRLKQTFAENGKQWPRNYTLGDHVAGACGVFKGSCVAQMLREGFLDKPFRDLGEVCKLADDPLLSLFTHAAGYTFREMGDKAFIKWRMEADYRILPSQGYLLYHPTKLVPGNQSYSIQREMECRNFFRALRDQKPIRMLPDSPRTGRPNSVLC